MSNLNTLTLARALKLVSSGDVAVRDVIADTLAAIARDDKTLNSYLSVADTVDDSAIKSDSVLKGMPIALKDNFCTSDLPTTAAAHSLENYIPPYEATQTTKLREAGAFIVGKTNLDAWAHGSSTETSQFGRTLNARNLEHLPGGSSGGSASAVAGDLCIAATGTETAGSIRLPASWCGVVGLKPTYGRCSRYGIVPMASSTDSPGPIAKTVEDCAILLNCMAGKDPYDATTSPKSVPDYTSALNKSIKGLKIGYIYHELAGFEEAKQKLEKELEVFTELGALVEEAHALDPQYAITSYTIFQRSEVSSNLARFDGIRFGKDRSKLGAEAKRRIMLGTYTLSKGFASKYYSAAQKVRTLYAQDYQKLFQKYDVLICLSSPGYAPKVGASEGQVMFGELADMFHEPSSITGLPGINVPCYQDPQTNLFLGMNIVAPMFHEGTLISVADAYERATKWNTWRNQEGSHE